MTINAKDTRFIVDGVGGIQDPILMTASAERVGIAGCVRFLGMDFVAVCAGHVCRPMTA
jgi:hypothetical protein